MKRLSGRPAASRKPLTRFCGITASESGLLPLKTDRSTRTPRTTSNGGLSLPCSSSALMNSHTKKLNNRRHIERHTKTGNHKKVSCFFTPILLISGFTVWENTAAKLAESTPRKPGENGKSQHSGIRQLLRARFYHSTKFRLPAHFVLRESCWGCHPKPAFLRLTFVGVDPPWVGNRK